MAEKKKKRKGIAQSTSAIPADDDMYLGPGIFCQEAFMNEDILQSIFEHFDLQPGSRTAAQTRRSLLSAAKAFKAFVEPALDSLWRILPSLLPLLLLLPSAEVSNNRYYADNLSSNNWERFEIHARRVRILYMESHRHSVVIPPTIYLHIRGLRDSHILPGLKEIYIPDVTSLDLFSIILLVSGDPIDLNVVELNRSAISDRSFFMPFLTLLASKSPQLGHLVLRKAGDVSLEVVHRFTSLQRLETRLSGKHPYSQTLRKLGSLVNLLDLTLDVGPLAQPLPIGADTSILHPPNYGHFKKLKKLHITGTPSSITRVLDDINVTPLVTLVIDGTPENMTGEDIETIWKRLFNQISVCLAIEDIEINEFDEQQWGRNGYSLSASWFSPLLNLNNIKTLVINNPVLSASDDDLRLMARAFPNLKKFVLPPAHYNYSMGRKPTLACLYHFSQECADIREIKICLALDISENLNAIKNLPRPMTRNYLHPLRKLYINSGFGQLQPTHLIKAAQFLDCVFPNLSVLETYNSETIETINWTGVHEFRLALQDARISASSASSV